jgi:hypothetical protein
MGSGGLLGIAKGLWLTKGYGPYGVAVLCAYVRGLYG